MNNNKPFKNETLVLKKEAWIALNNYVRMKQKLPTLPREVLERRFARMSMRNLGANGATHPIADDEIRIMPRDYDIPGDELIFFLDVLNYPNKQLGVGYAYRNDGYIQEGIDL